MGTKCAGIFRYGVHRSCYDIRCVISNYSNFFDLLLRKVRKEEKGDIDIEYRRDDVDRYLM